MEGETNKRVRKGNQVRGFPVAWKLGHVQSQRDNVGAEALRRSDIRCQRFVVSGEILAKRIS